MYQYLKSIGFGKYKTRKEINELICFVKENANYKPEYDLNEKESICLYEKEAGEGREKQHAGHCMRFGCSWAAA